MASDSSIDPKPTTSTPSMSRRSFVATLAGSAAAGAAGAFAVNKAQAPTSHARDYSDINRVYHSAGLEAGANYLVTQHLMLALDSPGTEIRDTSFKKRLAHETQKFDELLTQLRAVDDPKNSIISDFVERLESYPSAAVNSHGNIQYNSTYDDLLFKDRANFDQTLREVTSRLASHIRTHCEIAKQSGPSLRGGGV